MSNMSLEGKNIVVLVGAYTPKASAVGICAERVVNELVKIANVTVICREGNNQPARDDEAEVVSLSRYRQESPSILHKSIKISKFLLSKESIDENLVAEYTYELTNIGNKKNIDLIIPFCFPYEAILSSVNYKKEVSPNSKVIPYIFDNFSNSASLHRFDYNRRVKFKSNLNLELSCYCEADFILAMHPLKNHFDRFFPKHILKKVSYIEHPLLERNGMEDKSGYNKMLNLNYSGGFFRNVREPTFMLDSLDLLSREIDFNVDFYCFGSAAGKVEKFSEGSNFSTYHGKVNRDKVLLSYSKADILISMGEKEGKQISSKVFEYMSLGKPILHYSFVNECVVSKILSDYPLACVVLASGDVKDSLNVLLEFLVNCSKLRLEFEEIECKFEDATPKYASSRLQNLYRSCFLL